MVLADVFKRWQQLKNRNSILGIGTKEHGLRVQQAAAKADDEPQDFSNKGTELFKELAERSDTCNDVLIRTTDRRHKEGVEYAWQMLQQGGHIYEKKHEGWYSAEDETFYPQNQVQLIVEPPTGRKIMVSIETGREVGWISERNYFFRLTAFKDRLLQLYRRNQDFLKSEAKMFKLIKEVKAGLDDLSVSSPVERLTWGVRVPLDPSQTISAWFDALLSHASALGFPFAPGSETAAGWPPDLHVAGREKYRLYCIYWPAILIALDLPLPKQVLTHGSWTLGKQKLAKSTGNVSSPTFALERFGIDVVRFYLIHEGRIGINTDYDNRYVIKLYQGRLQRGLGFLASRVTRDKGWDIARAVRHCTHPMAMCFDGKRRGATVFEESGDEGRVYYETIRTLPALFDKQMHSLSAHKAVRLITQAVLEANQRLEQEKPWLLVSRLEPGGDDAAENKNAVTEPESRRSGEDLVAEIDRVVYWNAELLRLAGILLQPIMPATAKRLLDMLGVSEERRDWYWCYVGKDGAYGKPFVHLGKGKEGVLFPDLTSDF